MKTYEKINSVEFSATITKGSIFKSDKVVKARIAIGIRKDTSIFKNIVLFADKETGKIEGGDLVVEGAKVIVKGRLSLETNTREGYAPREEIIVDSIRENIPVETEEETAEAPAAEAPGTDLPSEADLTDMDF
jgi:hypothetical protein